MPAVCGDFIKTRGLGLFIGSFRRFGVQMGRRGVLVILLQVQIDILLPLGGETAPRAGKCLIPAVLLLVLLDARVFRSGIVAPRVATIANFFAASVHPVMVRFLLGGNLKKWMNKTMIQAEKNNNYLVTERFWRRGRPIVFLIHGVGVGKVHSLSLVSWTAIAIKIK